MNDVYSQRLFILLFVLKFWGSDPGLILPLSYVPSSFTKGLSGKVVVGLKLQGCNESFQGKFKTQIRHKGRQLFLELWWWRKRIGDPTSSTPSSRKTIHICRKEGSLALSPFPCLWLGQEDETWDAGGKRQRTGALFIRRELPEFAASFD